MKLAKFIKRCLDPIFSLFSPVMYFMAKTGIGTNFSYKLKVLPLRIHYYSPIPDIKELERRTVWEKTSGLYGINFDVESQLNNLQKISRVYGQECNWPRFKTKNENQFYYENSNFTFICASVLHSLIRYQKPKNIIEIGVKCKRFVRLY